ncbi:MAG: dehydrogenase [Candidatus Wallbacteria bacterium]|nr:dehydrogenase [Candidatus Wallbacteria bacterium]
MIFRSKAPLRLGLAGGGTDVHPYSDIFGGTVLNTTISLYAYASIEPAVGTISLNAVDRGEKSRFPALEKLELNGKLDLIKAVYNRLVERYSLGKQSFELSTCVDSPPGSGLGSSSTLVVAIVGAFAEWHKLPLGKYEIAHLAYEIERLDMLMAGGKQDHYSAAFGGFNFIEFSGNDRVLVNPLRVKDDYLNELQHNLVLYYTGTSRLSSRIIEAQVRSVTANEEKAVQAMHKLKEQAVLMKEAILKGKLDEIGELLNFGWKYKKDLAEGISNPMIDEIYDAAIKAGATGGKLTGAGGGGFMIFYCPANKRHPVIERLKEFGGEFRRFQFVDKGLETWAS